MSDRESRPTRQDAFEQDSNPHPEDGFAPENENLITGMGGGDDPISTGVSVESDLETVPPSGRIAAPQEVPGANPAFANPSDPSGNDPLTDKGRDIGS